jgi:glyceraldehyde-3-phosphate dehydrogenase/erythrose-4-phosphate dehydrogenase
MERQRIAIIGLGRIGSAFLRQIGKRLNHGLELVCVAEVMDTPGRQTAVQAGIKVCSLDEIVAMGDGIDVVFELTGLPDVRRQLREKLVASGNNKTVIASESIVRVIWALISDEALPVIPGRVTGY